MHVRAGIALLVCSALGCSWGSAPAAPTPQGALAVDLAGAPPALALARAVANEAPPSAPATLAEPPDGVIAPPAPALPPCATAHGITAYVPRSSDPQEEWRARDAAALEAFWSAVHALDRGDRALAACWFDAMALIGRTWMHEEAERAAASVRDLEASPRDVALQIHTARVLYIERVPALGRHFERAAHLLCGALALYPSPPEREQIMLALARAAEGSRHDYAAVPGLGRPAITESGFVRPRREPRLCPAYRQALIEIDRRDYEAAVRASD